MNSGFLYTRLTEVKVDARVALESQSNDEVAAFVTDGRMNDCIWVRYLHESVLCIVNSGLLLALFAEIVVSALVAFVPHIEYL